MQIEIGCIVEGHGETEAVPILIRRLASHMDPAQSLRVLTFRAHRSKVVKPLELERAIELASSRLGRKSAIVVLLDSDDDCPAQLGPVLLSRARAARGDIPIAVILAKREFEPWFMAAAESLNGVRGLPGDLAAPADPESIRGAKEWFGRKMPGGYNETLHQPAFTATFDLVKALRADSFDKCYREIARLLAILKSTA